MLGVVVGLGMKREGVSLIGRERRLSGEMSGYFPSTKIMCILQLSPSAPVAGLEGRSIDITSIPRL